MAQGQEMAVGDVVHMGEVEAGIDEGGHPPEGRLDDDPPGGGRLDVAGADGPSTGLR